MATLPSFYSVAVTGCNSYYNGNCTGRTRNSSMAPSATHWGLATTGDVSGGRSITVAGSQTLVYCGGEVGSPKVTDWAAGTWAVNFDVTSANMNLSLEEIYICRVDSSCGAVSTVGSLTGIARNLGTAGQVTHNVSGAASSGSASDQFIIVFVLTNSSMSTQSVYYRLQSVVTPIVAPAPDQTGFRWRRDDNNEASATWDAALNTNISAAPGTKRIRAEVDYENGVGAVAFGWQYRDGPLASVRETTATLAQLYVYGGDGANYSQMGQQVLIGTAGSVSKVWWNLLKIGSPTDNLYCEIRSGSFTGTLLATSDALAATSLTAALEWYGFTFASPVSLSGSTSYYFIIRRSGAYDATNYCKGATTSYGSNDYTYSASYRASDNAWYNTTAALDVKIGGTLWAALPAQGTSNVPVRFAASTNVTDAGATTQQIGSGTFYAGRIYETAHTSTTDVTAAGKTEHEAVIEMVSGQVADGDIFDFRVVSEV